MNLRPDDPKLSAWLLGELSAEESAEVERAVAADPALKLATQDLERVLKLLSNTLAPQQVELFPRQRNLILQEARRMDAEPQVLPFPVRAKTPASWFMPMAAAAAVALACWALIQLPGDPASQTAGTSKDPAAQDGYWPTPAPSDPGAPSVVMPATQKIEAHPEFPVLIPRGISKAAENPVLNLPVSAGNKSLGWVERSVREEKRLPHPHAVRFEEIVNRFPLRPSGTAALAKGVALSAEAVACPWNPSGQLLVITMRGASGASRAVSASFHADAKSVHSYRLLGYAHAQGAAQGASSTQLAAGASHSLVIELQATTDAGSFGTIRWTVDGEDATPLDVVRRSDAVPSKDARFASLVAAGCLWLADPSTPVHGDVLAAMIRENQTGPLTVERADFVRLLDQALALAK